MRPCCSGPFLLIRPKKSTLVATICMCLRAAGEFLENTILLSRARVRDRDHPGRGGAWKKKTPLGGAVTFLKSQWRRMVLFFSAWFPVYSRDGFLDEFS